MHFLKYCLISTLFLCFKLEKTSAQTLEETLSFANKQFDNQDFIGAADTFERVLFFDSTQQFSNGIYIKLAECLFNQQKLDEAARQYEKAFYIAENDSIKNHILFQKATCYLIEKNYASAQIELFSLPDSLSENNIKKRELMLGMATFAMSDFEASQQHFNNYVGTDATKQQQLLDLFAKNKKISKINPKKARKMSMFLPGLGQFYAGDVKNGFNSLLLTGGLLTWGVRIALQSTFLDAALTVIPWFQRYYVGGYTRAEGIAENAIKKRRHKVYNEILDVVE